MSRSSRNYFFLNNNLINHYWNEKYIIKLLEQYFSESLISTPSSSSSAQKIEISFNFLKPNLSFVAFIGALSKKLKDLKKISRLRLRLNIRGPIGPRFKFYQEDIYTVTNSVRNVGGEAVRCGPALQKMKTQDKKLIKKEIQFLELLASKFFISGQPGAPSCLKPVKILISFLFFISSDTSIFTSAMRINYAHFILHRRRRSNIFRKLGSILDQLKIIKPHIYAFLSGAWTLGFITPYTGLKIITKGRLTPRKTAERAIIRKVRLGSERKNFKHVNISSSNVDFYFRNRQGMTSGKLFFSFANLFSKDYLKKIYLSSSIDLTYGKK